MSRRLLGLCLAMALLSCTAYRLPAPAAGSQPDLLQALGTAVIVRSTLPQFLSEQQADAFLTRLRDDLISTGLFEAVEVGSALETTNVVVHPEYEPRHCFAEPILTVITLGVIPYPGCYSSGYRLTMSGPRFARDIVVDNRSQPLALWGWVAGPIGLFPGWSWDLPVNRERESLRISIESAVAAGS